MILSLISYNAILGERKIGWGLPQEGLPNWVIEKKKLQGELRDRTATGGTEF